MLIYEDPIELAMLCARNARRAQTSPTNYGGWPRLDLFVEQGAAARLLYGSCVYLCGFSSYLG
jgi:hypothetical protein